MHDLIQKAKEVAKALVSAAATASAWATAQGGFGNLTGWQYAELVGLVVAAFGITWVIPNKPAEQ